jgi:hypothetical protein
MWFEMLQKITHRGCVYRQEGIRGSGSKWQIGKMEKAGSIRAADIAGEKYGYSEYGVEHGQ